MPVAGGPGRLLLQGRSQVKGVGAAGNRFGYIGWCQQGGEGGSTGLEAAHQPVLQLRFLQPAEACQGAQHQPLGHAHPQAAGEQLVGYQQLGRAQSPPEVAHRRRLLAALQGGGGRQQLLHPMVQGVVV